MLQVIIYENTNPTRLTDQINQLARTHAIHKIHYSTTSQKDKYSPAYTKYSVLIEYSDLE